MPKAFSQRTFLSFFCFRCANTHFNIQENISDFTVTTISPSIFKRHGFFFRSSLRCMQLIIIWMIIECEPRFDIQLNLSTYDIVVGHACMLAPIELNTSLPIDLVHWRCTIWRVEFISLVLITLCTQIILIKWFFHLKSQKLKTMKKKRLNSIRNAFARLREVINFFLFFSVTRIFFLWTWIWNKSFGFS